MSIFDSFKFGLSKSSKSLSSGLKNLILKKKIDEDLLDELEDFLISSDVGVEISAKLKNTLREIKVDPKNQNKNEIYKIFSEQIIKTLKPLERNFNNLNKNKPCVILVAGAIC